MANYTKVESLNTQKNVQPKNSIATPNQNTVDVFKQKMSASNTPIANTIKKTQSEAKVFYGGLTQK